MPGHVRPESLVIFSGIRRKLLRARIAYYPLAVRAHRELRSGEKTLRQTPETRERDRRQQPASVERRKSTDARFALTAIRMLQVPNLQTAVAGYARTLAGSGAPL